MPTHYEKNEELPSNPDVTDVNAFVPIGIRMREGEQKLIKLVIPGLEPPLLFAKVDVIDGEATIEVVDQGDVDVIDEESVVDDELAPETTHSEEETEDDDPLDLTEDEAGEETEYYKVTKEDGESETIEVSGIPEERKPYLQDCASNTTLSRKPLHRLMIKTMERKVTGSKWMPTYLVTLKYHQDGLSKERIR